MINGAYLEASRNKSIENRESQLWWLAVLVILLLAIALFFLDFTNSPGGWWFSSGLEFALNTRMMRAGLILATLLICAYFRDSARKLRQMNNKLIGNLEEKNQELSKLKDLSERLMAVNDLRSGLESVVDLAVDVIGANTASIMLREKDEDTLRIVASRGISQKVVNSTLIKVGESIAGLVVQNGEAVILNSDDLTGDVAVRATRKHSILSSVIVPIHVNSVVRGVLCVAKRRGSGECFSEVDMEILSTLANQTSLVMQKIELLDNLRNQIDILASTLEELKVAQAGLIQSEKLASIGMLAGGVAHEINNPLQIILGRIELLLAEEKDKLKEKHLVTVREQTSRIANIVSNLLSFSRQNSEAGVHPIDVNEVLNKTLDLVRTQMTPDMSINNDLQSDLPSVLGNHGQLQQVFTNIAFNAYQAMRKQEKGVLTVRSKLKADMVEVEFTDTGPGIPEEHLDHLFMPFFTTKPEGEGTGLGLSIAYGIIQSHGGLLQACNNPGGGACFSMTLPVIPSEDQKVD